MMGVRALAPESSTNKNGFSYLELGTGEKSGTTVLMCGCGTAVALNRMGTELDKELFIDSADIVTRRLRLEWTNTKISGDENTYLVGLCDHMSKWAEESMTGDDWFDEASKASSDRLFSGNYGRSDSKYMRWADACIATVSSESVKKNLGVMVSFCEPDNWKGTSVSGSRNLYGVFQSLEDFFMESVINAELLPMLDYVRKELSLDEQVRAMAEAKRPGISRRAMSTYYHEMLDKALEVLKVQICLMSFIAILAYVGGRSDNSHLVLCFCDDIRRMLLRMSGRYRVHMVIDTTVDSIAIAYLQHQAFDPLFNRHVSASNALSYTDTGMTVVVVKFDRSIKRTLNAFDKNQLMLVDTVVINDRITINANSDALEGNIVGIVGHRVKVIRAALRGSSHSGHPDLILDSNGSVNERVDYEYDDEVEIPQILKSHDPETITSADREKRM